MSESEFNMVSKDAAWAQAWAVFEDEHGAFPPTGGGLLHRARRRAGLGRRAMPYFPDLTLDECLEVTTELDMERSIGDSQQ
jgi:hypothetical protein